MKRKLQQRQLQEQQAKQLQLEEGHQRPLHKVLACQRGLRLHHKLPKVQAGHLQGMKESRDLAKVRNLGLEMQSATFCATRAVCYGC